MCSNNPERCWDVRVAYQIPVLQIEPREDRAVDQQLYSQAVWFISRLDKRYAINKGVGWVYALRNSEFKHPLLKIGMTTKSPHKRAYELGSATGVPGKFDIVYFIHAVNCGYAEFHVHERLANYRKTGEFFDVPIGVAVDAMDEAAKKFAINLDLARSKKRGGSGEWLPQVFRHAVSPCPHCGKKNKVHMLAVPFVPKCGKCRRNLSG